MYEFGPLPDELPKFETSVEALQEFDRILMKTRRSLTVAAVRLAADRESPGRKKTPVAVETEDVLQAAKNLFAPDNERPIAWLNDLLDLLVYSSCFLSHSPVLREIERALQREDDQVRRTGQAKHILFPIRLDNFLFDTWQHARKPDVLTKVVGDFRGWNRNPNTYDAAFRKLLGSLNAK